MYILNYTQEYSIKKQIVLIRLLYKHQQNVCDNKSNLKQHRTKKTNKQILKNFCFRKNEFELNKNTVLFIKYL